MGDTLVFTLIRHGLTSFNEEKRYLGWKNLSLSTRGIAEVQSLAPIVSDQLIDLLITSDLLRSQETAQLLFPNQSMRSFFKLREFNFGDWEGQTYEELTRLELYRKWLNDTENVTPPKGESFQEFQTRTNEAFHELLNLVEEKKAQHITVVCHGGVIRQWLSMFSPVKRDFFEWHIPTNARFICTGHLNELRRGSTFISLQEEPITAKINGY